MANEQNLKPFTGADDPRRMNGRPKGVKNLATIIRELENEEFDWSKIPVKDRDKAKAIGAPWRAKVYTAIAKAYAGDVKAMEWLRKSGYGNSLDLTSGGEPIKQAQSTAEIMATVRAILHSDEEDNEYNKEENQSDTSASK